MTGSAKIILLSFFFSLCASAIFVTHYLQGRAPVPAPRELYSVVNSQLAAFRAADFSQAYYHSASSVQQKFSRQQFESMVRSDYAEMTQVRRVEFGFVRIQGASASVQVFFFAPDGTVEPYLYNLIAEEEAWKIVGVQPLHSFRASRRLDGLHA